MINQDQITAAQRSNPTFNSDEVSRWLSDRENMYNILESLNNFDVSTLCGHLFGTPSKVADIQLVNAFQNMIVIERQVEFQLITDHFLRFVEESASGHPILNILNVAAIEEMERQLEANTVYQVGEP